MDTIEYTPTATVEKFIQDESRVSAIFGPFGSGKSVGSIFKIIYRAQLHPQSKDGIRHSRWAIIRNTKPQLNDTTIKTFNKWVIEGPMGYWRLSEKVFHLKFNDVHCEILFRGLDDANDVRNVLSLELTGAWFNELREINSTIFNAVRGRCGRYPAVQDIPYENWKYTNWPYWYGVLGDSNMPDDDSYYYEQFETKQPAGWTLYKQPPGLLYKTDPVTKENTYYPNPDAENIGNLAPTYYTDQVPGSSKSWVLVNLCAEYGSSDAGKPVYENTFNESYHVGLCKPDPALTLLIGLDLGRTPAAIIKQVTPHGVIMTLDEVIGNNIGLSRFLNNKLIPHILNNYPGFRVLVAPDPAAGQTSQHSEFDSYDILDQAKLKYVKVPTNDIDLRIEAVERALSKSVGGTSGYVIHPRCSTLIKGFKKGYKYKQKRDGSHEIKPMKNEYSHPHDANQYVDLVILEKSLNGTVLEARKTALPVAVSNAQGWS